MADGDVALLLAPNPSSIQSYQISNHILQTQGCQTHYLYEPMQARNLAQKGKQPFACTFFAHLTSKIQSTNPLLLFLRENQQLT